MARKDQPLIRSSNLRNLSRQNYDVIVCAEPAVADCLAENEAPTEAVWPIPQNEEPTPEIRQERSLLNCCALVSKGLLVILAVVFAATGWAVSRHQLSPLTELPAHRTVDSDNAAVAKLVERADQHIARKQLESALVDLNTAIRLNPRQSNLYRRRALIHEQLGGYFVAIKDCERALELCVGTPQEDETRREAKKLRVHCLHEVLKFDSLPWTQQIAKLSDEIAVHPTAERLSERADIYEYQKRLDLALADFSEAAQLEPNNIDILLRMACIRQDLHRYTEAIGDYSKIIDWPNRFDKDDISQALSARAQCYRQLNRMDLALVDEQASDQLGAVASGKIELEKLLPIRNRQRQRDPVQQGICTAVQVVPNLLDWFPQQNRSNVTLAIDESIANPSANQLESSSPDEETNSQKADGVDVPLAQIGDNRTSPHAGICEAGLTDAGLYKLSKSADCESLDLSGTAVTDAGLQCLAGKKIKRLALARTGVTADGIRNLGLQPELTALSLDWDDHISDAVIKDLGQFPKLTFLSLRNTKVSDRGIKKLPETAAKLESLYLQGDDIGDEGIPAISQLRSLVYLDLDHANIQGKTLEKLASLPELRYLDLSFAHSLQQRYLVQLLERRPTLFELYLTEDEVDDSIVPAVSSVDGLRSLDIGLTNVTSVGYKVLARSKTLKSIVLGQDYDQRDLASFKESPNNSIKIGPGMMLSADFWPKVITNEQ